MFVAERSDVTVEGVHSLFEQIFSKAVDGASVAQVFSDEWDSYRKVSV